jgi:hypothetical protein
LSTTTKTQVNFWSALHELVNVFDVSFVKQFQMIIMHDLGEICPLKRKLMGFFFQKHLMIAVSEIHLLLHKMLDFRSFLGGLPPRPPTRLCPGPTAYFFRYLLKFKKYPLL